MKAFSWRFLDAFHWVVSSVPLPNGDEGPLGSYSFDYSDNRYHGYGELRSMTVPTGARYDYRYRLDVENIVCNPQSLTQCTTGENIAHYNSVREKTVEHDGLNPSDLHWVYKVDRFAAKTIITNPDGGTSVYWFNPSWLGYNIGDVVYRIDKPNGAVQKRSWAQHKVWHLRNTANPNNPYVEREAVTLEHAANTASRTAVTASRMRINSLSVTSPRFAEKFSE